MAEDGGGAGIGPHSTPTFDWQQARQGWGASCDRARRPRPMKAVGSCICVQHAVQRSSPWLRMQQQRSTGICKHCRCRCVPGGAYPTGRIMNSCMASALPAWLPPLMMLNEGTGRICRAMSLRMAFGRVFVSAGTAASWQRLSP